MRKVLIAYVSPHGSTKEVAVRIGRIMADYDYDIEVLDLSKIRDIKAYDGIILGAPINGLNWHAKALQFVQDHQSQLKERPIAVFSLGLMAHQGRKFFRNRDRKAVDKVATLTSAVSSALFGGFATRPMPAPARWIFGLEKDFKRDQRKWQEIETWAHNLTLKL